MRLIIAAVMMACVTAAQADAPRYKMTVLGDLPGGLDHSIGSDINDNGVVVGSSHVGDGSRAFTWDETNGMRQLFADSQPMVDGVRGYTVYTDSHHEDSLKINNSGQVGGRIGNGWAGFIYTSPDQPVKVYGSQINAMNDRGQFLGVQYESGSPYGSGYLSNADNSRVTLQGTGSTSITLPMALNESGQAAGSAMLSGTGWDAVIWDASGNATSLNARTGPFTQDSFAVAINDKGVVAGYRRTSTSGTGAFIWSAATGIVDLGAPAGVDYQFAQSAVDINNAGVVIGNYGYKESFYWTQETGMVMLNDLIDGFSPYTTLMVSAINESGQIVGTIGTESESGMVWHGVVLTPVPEPGTLPLLGFGLAAILTKRHLKARTCKRV